MTWSHDAVNEVYNEATWSKSLTKFLLTLNGLGDPTTNKGGWTVGRPIGAEDVTCLFTFLNYDNTTKHFQFSIDESSYSEGVVFNTQVNASYNSAITDPNDPNRYPYVATSSSAALPETDYFGYSNPTGTTTIKIWRSSENPTAFVGFTDDRAYVTFFPFDSIAVSSDAGYGGTGYVDHLMYIPSFLGNTGTICGYPLTILNDDITGSQLNYPCLPGPSSSGRAQATGAIYKDFVIQSEGVQICKLTQDTLWNMPAGTPWQSGASNSYTYYIPTSFKATPAYDGTDYYIYLCGGPLAPGFVLNCGSQPYPVS